MAIDGALDSLNAAADADAPAQRRLALRNEHATRFGTILVGGTGDFDRRDEAAAGSGSAIVQSVLGSRNTLRPFLRMPQRAMLKLIREPPPVTFEAPSHVLSHAVG
jgi:hypothetical protein